MEKLKKSRSARSASDSDSFAGSILKHSSRTTSPGTNASSLSPERARSPPTSNNHNNKGSGATNGNGEGKASASTSPVFQRGDSVQRPKTGTENDTETTTSISPKAAHGSVDFTETSGRRGTESQSQIQSQTQTRNQNQRHKQSQRQGQWQSQSQSPSPRGRKGIKKFGLGTEASEKERPKDGSPSFWSRTSGLRSRLRLGVGSDLGSRNKKSQSRTEQSTGKNPKTRQAGSPMQEQTQKRIGPETGNLLDPDKKGAIPSPKSNSQLSRNNGLEQKASSKSRRSGRTHHSIHKKKVLDLMGTEKIQASLNGPIGRLFGESGLRAQTNVIETMQSWKLRGAPTISYFGSSKVVLISLCLLLWLSDPALGWRPPDAAAKMMSFCGIAKALLRGPRPYFIAEKVKTLDPSVESSYGFPSGHTAAVISVFGLAFSHFVKLEWENVWLWVAYAFFVCLVGMSRIYTGAHFFHDVIGGALLGFVLLYNEHAGGPQGHLIGSVDQASYLFAISCLCLGAILFSTREAARLHLKLNEESLAGAGLSLGLGLCHVAEHFAIPSRPEDITDFEPVHPLLCILGLLGILLISKAIHKMPDGRGEVSVVGAMVCVLLYACIMLTAIYVVPLTNKFLGPYLFPVEIPL